MIGLHCAQEFKTRAHVSEMADPLWGIKELPLNQKEGKVKSLFHFWHGGNELVPSS